MIGNECQLTAFDLGHRKAMPHGGRQLLTDDALQVDQALRGDQYR